MSSIEVKTGDLDSFQEAQGKDSDVIIFDYDGRGFESPRPSLSEDYARATITVGVVGALICDSVRLKSGYL